jgi:hypothetical protein
VCLFTPDHQVRFFSPLDAIVAELDINNNKNNINPLETLSFNNPSATQITGPATGQLQ